MMRKKDYKDPDTGVLSEEPGREGEPKAENPAPGDLARLQEDLERARAREDELLRAVAELTNVNRRRKQDAELLAAAAEESLVRNILPVLDDIDRAIAASKDREEDPFRSGVLLIRDRLWRTLAKEGLERIEAEGAPFDPELHDAVSQLPSADAKSGTVLEVILPGYRFKGRVLRHAQVVVAGPRDTAKRGSAEGKGQAAPDAGEHGI